MSNEPLVIPPPPAQEDTLATTISPAEATYFLQVVDFYRPVIQDVLNKIPPMELVFILAYLQGALESQEGAAGKAFNEARQFWGQLYPIVLGHHREAHPDEAESGFLMVIPTPEPMLAVNKFTDEPQVIQPGSQLVN